MSGVEDQAIATNWPIRLYAGSLMFALVSMLLSTTTLGGAEMNAARAAAQFSICIVLGFRLCWAIKTREQNKTWIAYVVGMFLAVPIWLIVEPWVLRLG